MADDGVRSRGDESVVLTYTDLKHEEGPQSAVALQADQDPSHDQRGSDGGKRREA